MLILMMKVNVHFHHSIGMIFNYKASIWGLILLQKNEQYNAAHS